MYERVWRNAQNCAVKQGLAAGSRGWLVACKPPKDAHEWSMQKNWTIMLTVALQDKKSSLAIQLSRSQVASPLCYEKMTLHIPFSLQYKYPIYPRNVESFQKEFWERNPREKQDWLIHNLYIMTLQIPQLSPSQRCFTLSIVTSLRGSLAKTFLTIPISVRRLFSTLGSS